MVESARLLQGRTCWGRYHLGLAQVERRLLMPVIPNFTARQRVSADLELVGGVTA